MTTIDIISGFLGAGKTTLIKKLISEAYTGEKIVLIENEFGEIGIDGGFMRDAGIEITEMNSGCICCSLVGDFGEALKKVLEEYHPDRILIEPSGVGKLSDVIKAVRGLEIDSARLGGFCAVADVNKCKMYMKNFGEFYNDQIESAGCIILSHTEGAKQSKIDEAVALLREHNANAVIVTTPWSELEGKQISQAIDRTSTLESHIKALEHEAHEHHHHHDEDCECHEHHHHHDEDCECHEHHHHHDEDCDCHEHHHHHDEDCECHEHHHDEHHHHHGENCTCGCHDHDHHHHADEVFTSWGVETTKKFSMDEIKAILCEFAESDKFGMVLRAKGIVAGENAWIHFDYVPEEPDVREGGAAVTGRLCVIGCKLNEQAIAKLFKI